MMDRWLTVVIIIGNLFDVQVADPSSTPEEQGAEAQKEAESLSVAAEGGEDPKLVALKQEIQETRELMAITKVSGERLVIGHLVTSFDDSG